jgi:hypothetical protein
MRKKLKRIVVVSLIYFLACLLLGVINTGLSAYFLKAQSFRLAQGTALIARGAIFQFLLFDKVTPSHFFTAWDDGLKVLQDAPLTLQLLFDFKKTYTDKKPLAKSSLKHLEQNLSDEINQLLVFQKSAEKSWLMSSILKKLNFNQVDEYWSFIQFFQLFLQYISNQLELNKPVNLLILFQNNMELRATGGFPGSYAVLHIANNEPILLTVQDIYVPDGQLTGHVDPPTPIQEAFQQGFWKLRDANWHPDFPQSAERVQWFFSEIDYGEFDGVIATTFTPLQELLNITGPIEVPDFDLTVTSDNVYTILQRNGDKEFFAGSTKKRDTLAAFTTQLLLKMEDLSIVQYKNILELGQKELLEKNIVMTFDDPDLQVLSSLRNWDGHIKRTACDTQRCESDYFSIFEANLGVNKSNCCVKRSVAIDKKMSNGILTSKISVTYQNEGPGEAYKDVAGDYKAYVRFYFPQSTQISPPAIQEKSYTEFVREYKQKQLFSPITSEGYSVDTVEGMKELGMWIYVPDGKSHTIQFTTTTLLSPSNEYELIIQKQPGTLDKFNNWQINFENQSIFQGILKTDVSLK